MAEVTGCGVAVHFVRLHIQKQTHAICNDDDDDDDGDGDDDGGLR